MRNAIRVGAVLAATCFVFATAWAGALDPRLAALTQGGHAFVRAGGMETTAATRPQSAVPPRIRGNNFVQVYIHRSSRRGPLPSAATLRAVGATGIRRSRLLKVVQAWIPIDRLATLAAMPNVGRVSVPTYRRASAPLRAGRPLDAAAFASAATSVPSGLSIDATAVRAMQADKLTAIGATGKNIKIGVISTGISGLSASQQAGYLPAIVWVDPTLPGNGAEGTAMLEEVHAMAPGATLGFCGPQTTVDFLTCYQDFAKWGANVITDDLGFYFADGFSIGDTADGSFASSVASFERLHPDIAITSSAGNDDQDYFQAIYAPGPATIIDGTSYASTMNFGRAVGGASSSTLATRIYANVNVLAVLQWNDPLASPADDFTMYLLNSNGNVIQKSWFASSDDDRPLQYLSYTAGTSTENDKILIVCKSCSNPVTLKLNGWGDGGALFGITTGGAIQAGQKNVYGVLTTAAAAVVNQSPLTVNREAYSATGPFLYGDYDATSTVPGPDITGIDFVIVSGAGGFGLARSGGGAWFCGTSASSPNVAALIAELMQAAPGHPPAYYYHALENTAASGTFSSSYPAGCSQATSGYSRNAAGAGLAQGYAALASFFTFPRVSITRPAQVPPHSTGSITVPTSMTITYAAAVQSGTNPASADTCHWTVGNAATFTGASIAYAAPTPDTVPVVVNCPDTRGITSPSPTALTVSARNLPPPTIAISNADSGGFSLALTGGSNLSISARSNDTSVLPDSGITISPTDCGTSTLSCTVSLQPVAKANGSATVTVTAKDTWNRSASTRQKVTFTYTPASSGGGCFAWLDLLGLGLIAGLSLAVRERRHGSTC